jgi:hypothetical protein
MPTLAEALADLPDVVFNHPGRRFQCERTFG